MCTPQEAHISGMATLKMTNSKLHVSKAKITCFKCISQERQSLNRYKFPCKKPIGYDAAVLVVELFYKISKFQLNDICFFSLFICMYVFIFKSGACRKCFISYTRNREINQEIYFSSLH